VPLDAQLDRRGQGKAQGGVDALIPVERKDRGSGQIASPFALNGEARAADRSRERSAVEQRGRAFAGVLESDSGERRDPQNRRRLLLDPGFLEALAQFRFVGGLVLISEVRVAERGKGELRGSGLLCETRRLSVAAGVETLLVVGEVRRDFLGQPIAPGSRKGPRTEI